MQKFSHNTHRKNNSRRRDKIQFLLHICHQGQPAVLKSWDERTELKNNSHTLLDIQFHNKRKKYHNTQKKNSNNLANKTQNLNHSDHQHLLR
jgi:hypothetical protein